MIGSHILKRGLDLEGGVENLIIIGGGGKWSEYNQKGYVGTGALDVQVHQAFYCFVVEIVILVEYFFTVEFP